MSTMPSRKLRRGTIPLVFALACFLAAVETEAGEDTGWRLRVDFGFFDPGGDGTTFDTGTSTFRTDLRAGGGAGVRGEYQPSRWLGFEFGFFSGATVDIEMTMGNCIDDDTLVVLLDDTGAEVASNDDNGTDYCSLIAGQAVTGGTTYFIGAYVFTWSPSADYTLTVTAQ